MEQRVVTTHLQPDLMERAAAAAIVIAAIGVAAFLGMWGLSFLRDKPPPLWINPNEPAKTTAGEVIKRSVSVFSNVQHADGIVQTGWDYKDGGGTVPVRQYCHYMAGTTFVGIALNGVRLSSINGVELVPDIEGALAKCQWWNSNATDSTEPHQ